MADTTRIGMGATVPDALIGCNADDAPEFSLLRIATSQRASRHTRSWSHSTHRSPTGPNSAGNQRKNMMQAVDASLKRLKADDIDLYWVHIWDQMTLVEEVMRGLIDLEK